MDAERALNIMGTGKNRNTNIFIEIVKTLVAVIEEKDGFIKEHSQRVAGHCAAFLKKLGLSKKEIDKVYLAGLLHDIGKLYLPLEIVQKSENLTEDEMALVRQHPVIAEKVLCHLGFLQSVLPIIRHHHESFDGSGYPDGLKGDKIPFGAKVLSLMDAFDAMISPRPQRKALSTDEALEEINKSAGFQFDIDLTKDFVEFIKPTSNISQDVNAVNTQQENKPELRVALNEVIQKFKRGEIEIPVLPNIVHEIQKVIKNPISTTDDVAKVIEKDAVISLKLISISNSPMYRGTKKIQSVPDAVPRLGLKQTQAVITAIANRGLYKGLKEELSDLMEKMWRHSLACAYSARAIANKLRLEDIENFFLMGLIHDIGKVLVLKTLTEIASQPDSTKKDFGVDEIIPVMQDLHTNFGGALLERWGFGKDFIQVAMSHEGPNFAQTTEKEILLVNLANMLTRKIGYSLFEDDGLVLADLESARLLEIDSDTLDAVGNEMREVMQATANIF